ncbi:alkaline serine protease Alp1 [Geopyxis carbonaria]|nr:alkaline serine protease Alp1 [Geopyxis carbonaria]
MQYLSRFLLYLIPAFGALAAPIANDAESARLSAQIGRIVPDNYIVVLKPEISVQAADAHRNWANDLHSRRSARRNDNSLAGITATYSMSQLKGYAGSFDEETLNTIRESDDVAYIEKDQIAVALDIVTEPDVPSWGLARISQPDASSDLSTYYYDESAGEGATAYVIDTGVWLTHSEFEGRATFGANFSPDGDSDGTGHGTHVAGTIAGVKYGVAKKASIVAVKVLGDNGSGTYSTVISGVQWAANNATAKGTSRCSVANMSLGGPFSAALNAAVASAVASGLTFVVSAGNNDFNTAYNSPSSEPSAITVGATESSDVRAVYSNYGALVDIFAPGTNITSAWRGSDNAKRTISGTSMAAPHVAGTIAYLIGLEGLSGPEEITSRIKELAVPDIVTNPGNGSTTSFLYNGVFDYYY